MPYIICQADKRPNSFWLGWSWLAMMYLSWMSRPATFSPTSQPLIRQLLIDYPGAIISVSHDRRFIDEVAALHYQLDDESLVRTR